MVEFIGLLKVKVIKGTDLAIRDMMSSDPYVILTLGQQVSHLSFSLGKLQILFGFVDYFFNIYIIFEG